MHAMCCFSGKVESVSNTRIFARLLESDRQALIYAMSMEAQKEVAMVLPLPVNRGLRESALRFVDLSGYARVFDDLHACFPEFSSQTYGAKNPAPVARGLEVVQVGSYEASFVPTIGDFSRLDPRFRLPENVWGKLPGYAGFGFAVFKLRKGRQDVHPMAFDFHTAREGRLFFPTLHIHDGAVHDREFFDHVLYLQGSGFDLRRGGWQESPGLAKGPVECEKTYRIIRPDLHVHRLRLQGELENGDIVIKPLA